jgi:hypothetical protein
MATPEALDHTALLAALDAAGVDDVGLFHLKLRSNALVSTNVEDLLAEGYAALALASNGFRVRLSDSPDLAIEGGSQFFYGEVKHFRRKPQDDIDDRAFRQAEGELVPYGDTLDTEEFSAIEQVLNVARKKGRHRRTATVALPNDAPHQRAQRWSRCGLCTRAQRPGALRRDSASPSTGAPAARRTETFGESGREAQRARSAFLQGHTRNREFWQAP